MTPTPTPMPSAPSTPPARTAEPVSTEAAAITALCSLAGCPDRAAEFLAAGKKAVDVSEFLAALRAEESERHVITSHVSPMAGGRTQVQDLEAAALAMSKQNQGITKEQAFTQMLETHPEIYEAYRAQHNAAVAQQNQTNEWRNVYGR
jgi:hypothetical protein